MGPRCVRPVTNLSGGSGPYLFGIVDWPEHGRFGYDMTTAARTTVNALGVDVLRKVGMISRELGRPGAEVQSYFDDAAALTARMNETLRRQNGTYVDGLLANGSQSAHAGQHATSYAVALGIAPRADQRGRLQLGGVARQRWHVLGSAEGSLMTQRGRVSTSWTRDGDAASLEATVPVNVSAVVELPAGEYDVAGPGGAPAQALGTEGGFTRYRVGSGTGSFEQAS